MRKSFNFSFLNPWIQLLAIIILWAFLPPAFKSFSSSILYEAQAPILFSLQKIKDLQSFWSLKSHSKNQLIEANRLLLHLNANNQLLLQQIDSLNQDLSKLESLLQLPKLPEYDYIVARVTLRSITSWNHQLFINKGSLHSIQENFPVIAACGVVGRIKKVFTYSSIVELISSPTFRVTSRFQNDYRPITYQGLSNPSFSSALGQALNIPTDFQASLEKPLSLVSSRLGGTFPDGLHIGTITHIEPSHDGLFNRAKVSLSPDLHSLYEVTILQPIHSTPSDLPPSYEP